MTLSHNEINEDVLSFFEKENYDSCATANADIEERTGIVAFFECESDFTRLPQLLQSSKDASTANRIEYGDFQTNMALTMQICNRLRDNRNIHPQILLEPTCGEGNFILSAIETFDSLQQIFGIEIQAQYLWHLKFELLAYFLQHPQRPRPQIYLYTFNVFEFDFQQIIKPQIQGRELLLLGNPPWVTNTALSVRNADNLPHKSNFRGLKGLDAITGKGNFDIGESIVVKMLDSFSDQRGYMAFLIKNSVVKNLVFEQKAKQYPISDIEKLTIDAEREFKAMVDASLFVCKLDSAPQFTAREYDFYTSEPKATLGWVENKFASDTDKYRRYQAFDGVCPMVWRQGIKHDCSKVMELERTCGGFQNALGEEFELEEDLIYGLLKSSDLKGGLVERSRKYTIVTQRKIGQPTDPILERLPKTRAYLQRHKDYFLNRKSSIYKDKPMFSIFGVGDYSFKPYKVAISGLYKQTEFTLVKKTDKALMLDDTCYFLGFDTLEEAVITQQLLNSAQTQALLQSFIFTDAKRVITKELLMRIDLNAIIRTTNRIELSKIISQTNWQAYKNKSAIKTNSQLSLF